MSLLNTSERDYCTDITVVITEKAKSKVESDWLQSAGRMLIIPNSLIIS